jgi:hypothetical protein
VLWRRDGEEEEDEGFAVVVIAAAAAAAVSSIVVAGTGAVRRQHETVVSLLLTNCEMSGERRAPKGRSSERFEGHVTVHDGGHLQSLGLRPPMQNVDIFYFPFRTFLLKGI